MGTIRPYIIDDNDAIDLNLVTRVYIYEETKLALIMYGSDPVILEFSTKAKARMKFNEIMSVWSTKEYSQCCEPFVDDTDIELLYDRVHTEHSFKEQIQKVLQLFRRDKNNEDNR